MTSIELTAEERARKEATVRELRARAAKLQLAVGQEWEYLGPMSLVRPDKRFAPGEGSYGRSASFWKPGARIRIVSVAGQDRARTTRYVKINPPRGGNGGIDRQSHPIDEMTLVRSYRLVDERLEVANKVAAIVQKFAYVPVAPFENPEVAEEAIRRLAEAAQSHQIDDLVVSEALIREALFDDFMRILRNIQADAFEAG